MKIVCVLSFLVLVFSAGAVVHLAAQEDIAVIPSEEGIDEAGGDAAAPPLEEVIFPEGEEAALSDLAPVGEDPGAGGLDGEVSLPTPESTGEDLETGISPADDPEPELTDGYEPEPELPAGEISAGEEYSPYEDASWDLDAAVPVEPPETAPELPPEPEDLGPGAWDLAPGTEVLVSGYGEWYPGEIVEVSAGMFTVRYLDPSRSEEVIDREQFRIGKLDEGMRVQVPGLGGEPVEGVVVSRMESGCTVVTADGEVSEVGYESLVVTSP